MFLLRRNTLFKSSSFKLSAINALLLIGAFALSGILIWYDGHANAYQIIQEGLELEVHALESELIHEGLEPTIFAINFRVERPSAPEYWMVDKQGGYLAGAVKELSGPDGWREIKRPTTGRKALDDWLVVTKTLAGGERLSIGKNLSYAYRERNAVLMPLACIALLISAFTLWIGSLATRRVLARIRVIQETLLQVGEGNLNARFSMNSNDAGNDIDEIGVGVNDMLERIQDLVRGIRRVSRDVAHDLRTPLSQLHNKLELAKTAKSRKEQNQYINAAQHKVDDILRNFDAILRLSEIEAGVYSKSHERCDLAHTLKQVEEAYRPDIEQAGFTLEARIAPNCYVLSDADLLMQAASNLIENALKHCPKGTKIIIACYRSQENIILSVTDNGAGIPAADYEKIVQPFQRLDQSRTTAGSGLGLSIVSAIAKSHDAELTLSDANPGLKVTLSFLPFSS